MYTIVLQLWNEIQFKTGVHKSWAQGCPNN